MNREPAAAAVAFIRFKPVENYFRRKLVIILYEKYFNE
jgi:hypothetical protein